MRLPQSYSPELSERLSSEMAGKTILITGGLGLVGLGLLDLIAHLNFQFGAKVQTVLTATSKDALWIAEGKNTKFDFFQGNLLNQDFVASLPTADYVIHSAGYGQPAKFLFNKSATLRLNSEVTFLLRSKSTERFLFTSSSEVYSGLSHSNLLESEIGLTGPQHERASYIEGKRFGEVATLVQNEDLHSMGNVVRLALAYGPGVRVGDRRVINELISGALERGYVSILGGGDRLRTYCYVEDASEMILGALVFGTGEIYNVGGRSETSIKKMAMSIAEILSMPFQDLGKTEDSDSSPSNVNLDISKILSLIDKTDFVDFQEGLHRTVDWHKSLRGKFN